MRQKQKASAKTLPERPNLEHLKHAAKTRLREMQQGDPAAQLAKAQLQIAQEYGFKSWRALRGHLMAMPSQVAMPDMPEALLAQRLYAQSLPRREVVIDSILLDRYVGDYRLGYAIFSVTREHDQLFVKLTGQASLPVYPESAKKFFYKAVAAQIEFVEEDALQATALVLHQNGQEQQAHRVPAQLAEEAAGFLARRMKEGIAIPGSDAALRRQIRSMQENDGEPVLSEMTAELAEISRPQIPALKTMMVESGKLHSIAFIAVGQLGWDIYRAEFENGALICRIFLDEEGKVAGLLLGGGP